MGTGRAANSWPWMRRVMRITWAFSIVPCVVPWAWCGLLPECSQNKLPGMSAMVASLSSVSGSPTT